MQQPLPDEMWTLPEDTIRNEQYRLLFTEISTRLRSEMAEVPGFGVLQQMLIERIAFMYVWIRDAEASNDPRLAGRNYKETMQLWSTLAASLHKDSRSAVDREEIRNHIIKGVLGTINGVLDTMHVDVAEGLRDRFIEAFEGAEF